MNVEFVNPFINGLLNVMETMAQTTLKPGKPKRKQRKQLDVDRHLRIKTDIVTENLNGPYGPYKQIL